MTLKEFITRFCDDKTRVDIFDDYSTDEETVHYTGRVDGLLYGPEDYEELLNRYVEGIDNGKDGLILILVNK